MSAAKLRIGWFATARGSGSHNLLDATTRAISMGSLDVEIAFVFCNREPGEAEPADRFFELVRANGIPLLTLSSVRFRNERGGERSRPGEALPAWRAEFDAAVERRIAPFEFDFGVLAGYMLIFTAGFAERCPLLNLHPAAPGGPIGTWQEVIRALIEQRAQQSGVTIFRVTPEVDTGPAVSSCTYAIGGDEMAPLWRAAEGVSPGKIEETALFDAIRARGMARETPLVVETLRSFAKGERLFVARRAVGPDGREAPPIDLTSTVEAALAAGARGSA